MTTTHTLPWTVACAALLLAAACDPDIATDAIETSTMQFDSASTPRRLPEPTFLAINPMTGRIDLSTAGTPVPPTCTTLPPQLIASCEFGQYLQSLDGFPTTLPARAPADTGLDPATLTAANVVVSNGGRVLGDNERSIQFDPASSSIVVRPRTSWPVGSQIRIGVRGYANGVRTTEGKEVIASPVFALLRRDAAGESVQMPTWLLTCGAQSASAVSPECGFLSLVSRPGVSADAARESLLTLERSRQAYLRTRTWEFLTAAGLPKAEMAVAWGFPVHTASVIELDPASGRVPQVNAERTEIRLAVNGTVDPTTLSAAALGRPGAVALFDVNGLLSGTLATPAFQVTYEGGALVLRPTTALQAGRQYLVAVSRDVKNAAGAGLVPPPAVVFVTAQGAVSAQGKSTVGALTDEEAMTAEANRQRLALVLPALQEIAGIERAKIAYVASLQF